MKDMETSFKAVLETLQDMQEFVDAALAEGYPLDSKFSRKGGPEGIFARLAKRPKPLQHKDDERPPREKAYCRACKQSVPVEWAEFEDSAAEDDRMYSEHCVKPRTSLNPIDCKNSRKRVPDDIEITL